LLAHKLEIESFRHFVHQQVVAVTFLFVFGHPLSSLLFGFAPALSHYNLLFRWFVGMNMDEEVWNHAVFSKNRERLLNEEIAEVFFQRVLEQAQPYLSDEHFTVDGTLLEAWAGQKSFQRKDGKGGSGGPRKANFHGEKRRNDTHQSTTDPEARLYRKSKGSEAS
jgi:hypothetical protein